MADQKRVAVMVPAEPVSPTWLFEETGGRPVVELHVPTEGSAVLSVQEDAASGGRWLSWEYRQRRLHWTIPPLVAGEALWELLAGLQPYAERIAAGIAPPDERRAAEPQLTREAQAAAAELAAHLAHAAAGMPLVEAVDPATLPAEAIAELVTADTTDAALAEAAVRLSARITPSTPGGVVYVRGLAERVERARVLARRQVRSRLGIVAAMSEGGRQERDELIRRIKAWHDPGDTDRALGAAAGLSHGAVQKILKREADRDDALARVAPSVQALVQAWAPAPLPATDDTGDDEDDRDDGDGYDGEPSEWELEQEYTARQNALAARRAQQQCAVPGCRKPSRRIVKRWQVDDTALMTADDDDPDRTPQGHVPGLSVTPRYSGPTWTACGTIHARVLIDADRANPYITGSVPGGAPFHYEVESFRYIADDDDLPAPVRQVRHSLSLLGHSMEQFLRAVSAGDMAVAASYLESLRRDVARGALNLADLHTVPTPAISYPHGSPEPTEAVLWVRDGDTIYTRRSVFGRELWYGPDRTAKGRTWQELADAVAPRPLITIPRAVLQLPAPQHEDDDWDDRYDDSGPSEPDDLS
ncbi:hypothetical protein [Nonomuraea sp. NPDC005650]|uniref:hypothetical protein n=1 Tax=Nonomuraea sp. NPDC005650 TaxID=3157045 RepID=UPI0033ABF6CF